MLFKLFRSIRKLTDEQLISAYKEKGEIKYAAHLFERYSQLIAGVALKYLKHPQNAEDAAMDVFEILSRDLKEHTVRNPKNWLYSITKNHCLKLKRANSKELSVKTELQGENFMESNSSNTLSEKIEKEKEFEQLEFALAKLKAEQRTCVALFYLKKKSYQEIADETGYSLKKVKSYIQNGKRNLKIQMERSSE